jgi:sarcosine oxidase subunit gamma
VTGERYAVAVDRAPMAAAFEARGREAALAAALARAGLDWPAALHVAAVDGAGREVVRLGPTRALVLAPLDQEAALGARLEAAFADEPDADVAPMSDAFAAFVVSGPEAEDVLSQGAALDLHPSAFPPGRFTGTELWSVTALVGRGDGAPGAFRLLVDRAFAGYVEDWLAVAAGASPRARPATMIRPPARIRPG